jgi:hypothetical protein
MKDKTELINALFSKISLYEDDRSSFDLGEFQENFKGLLALFEALKDKPEGTRQADQTLSRRIKQFDVDRSDLRRVSLHLLTMHFKFSANVPHPLDRSYVLCREKRGSKKDATYLIEDLLPLVFEPGSLNDDYELKYFFLDRMAVFQIKFGGAPPLYDTSSIEEIRMIPKPLLLLGLIRRKEDRTGSIEREGTIETKCHRHRYFDALARENPFHRFILETNLGYVVPVSWYRRIWAPVKRSFSRVFSAFSSLNFLVYLLTRRRAAYFFYLALILLFLAASVVVPLWWKGRNQRKLEELKSVRLSPEVKSCFAPVGQSGDHREFRLC